MCEPTTIAIIGTAVATIGAGVSTYAQVQQQQYRSKVAAQNSRLEGERAAAEILRGQEERRTLARRYSALAGSQRAAMAANGIDQTFGTAEEFLGDTQMLYREDLKTAADNNAAAIRGIDISAANYMAESRAAKSAATGAAISGAFDMGSTILGGIGRVGKINAAKKAGGSGWSGF